MGHGSGDGSDVVPLLLDFLPSYTGHASWERRRAFVARFSLERVGRFGLSNIASQGRSTARCREDGSEASE